MDPAPFKCPTCAAVISEDDIVAYLEAIDSVATTDVSDEESDDDEEDLSDYPRKGWAISFPKK